MTTLSELLIKDKAVWSQQVSPLGVNLEKLEIVDGKITVVHMADEYQGFAIKRDASYDEEDEHFLFFLQELFFVIDNFENEFSVCRPMINGGYELSCLDDEKGYLHQRYVDYSYAEAREEFVEYVANYRVPFC